MAAKKTHKVLFVEDAFDQALLVKAFLGSMGDFDVTHSQDGDHAVKLLKDQAWDLLITDLNLPGTDGFEVIKVARDKYPTMPVLATTGYTGKAYQEQAFRSGATDMMIKPLDRDEFATKVSELLGVSAGSSPASVDAPEGPAVLAVGAHLGDVEMGCGASLAAAREAGHHVLILPLWPGEAASAKSAEEAANALGARLLLDPEAMQSTQSRIKLVELAVRDLAPVRAYIPTDEDADGARIEAARIAKAATALVTEVLAYSTATTELSFRPDRFEEVSDWLVHKMEALAAYQQAGSPRPDLAPRMAQAYARYWGRFNDFSEVEAFEVIRSE